MTSKRNSTIMLLVAGAATVAGMGLAAAPAHAAMVVSEDTNSGNKFSDYYDEGTADIQNLTYHSAYTRLYVTTSSDDSGFDGAGGNYKNLDFDFDAADSVIQVTARLHNDGSGGSNNDATFIGIQLIDNDPSGVERYDYQLPTASLTVDDYTTLSVPVTAFSDTSTASGSPDGVQNFGLDQIGIHTPFDQANTFDIDFQNVSIVSNVPEPASLALLGIGGLAMLGRRRRRAA